MKVLIVNRYMGLYGGAETVVKELAQNLARRGITPVIVTLNISDQVKKLCENIPVAVPPKFFPYKFRGTDVFSTLGILDEIVWLRRLVAQHAHDTDIINAHNFPAHWVCRGLGKPVVWMCNEIPDFYNNPHPSPAIKMLRRAGIGFDRVMTRHIAAICVADEFNAGRVRDRYGSPSEIIPYGIAYDFFSADDGGEKGARRLEKRCQAPFSLDGKFVLLQAGMISPEKNQMKSIEAVDNLRKEIPNLVLILAGRPQNPYDHILKERVKLRNLGGSVFFTGHITKEQLRGLYHICQAALFPVKSQGGWLAPFEALSAGTPVITSSTMGASTLIVKEGLGIVSDNLVQAIRDVYNNYPAACARARQARAWVRDNLTWERFTDKMIAVFERALGKTS